MTSPQFEVKFGDVTVGETYPPIWDDYEVP